MREYSNRILYILYQYYLPFRGNQAKFLEGNAIEQNDLIPWALRVVLSFLKWSELTERAACDLSSCHAKVFRKKPEAQVGSQRFSPTLYKGKAELL